MVKNTRAIIITIFDDGRGSATRRRPVCGRVGGRCVRLGGDVRVIRFSRGRVGALLVRVLRAAVEGGRRRAFRVRGRLPGTGGLFLVGRGRDVVRRRRFVCKRVSSVLRSGQRKTKHKKNGNTRNITWLECEFRECHKTFI